MNYLLHDEDQKWNDYGVDYDGVQGCEAFLHAYLDAMPPSLIANFSLLRKLECE